LAKRCIPAKEIGAMTDRTGDKEPSVLVRQDREHIATLTLNRPGQFNALSQGLLTALQDALEAVGEDRTIRVVVLAAAGKAFCAGHDLKEMRENPGQQVVRELFEQCSRLMLTINRIPQPVIARVHGIATAAGCQLVASCDLAVAAEHVRFAVSGVNLGLFCSTPMVALSRNLPRKQAMEMLLTGEWIDAHTACQYGLVNRVVPAAQLDAAVGDLADRIAAKSPIAVSIGKRMFYKQIEAGVEAAYAAAAGAMTCNMMSEDAQAGIDAFLARQPLPEWKGR
jgi:enoyl-CoA hydratase/carnithine racemase